MTSASAGQVVVRAPKTVSNDIQLEYDVLGDGEPMLLIHGSNLATDLALLATQLAVEAPHLQLVRYHRRGMAGSSGRGWPISVEQQAADAIGLLDALGLQSAHLLGYSYGGVVALEVALTRPDRTRLTSSTSRPPISSRPQ